MSSVWNRILALLFSLSLVLGLVGCAAPQPEPQPSPAPDSSTTPALEDCPVIEDTDFGGVYLDITIDEFNDLGFSFGDCVSIYFSNGYKLEYIPYYNGYYTLRGDPLLVGYPGYPHIAAKINSGDSLWQVAHLVEGDTATVVLEEKGAFATVQETYNLSYGNDRAGFTSDEQFANFRALSGGSLADGAFYRSASPIDDEFNRASYVNGLAQNAGVRFILDLSDSEEEIQAFAVEAEAKGTDITYFNLLDEEGNVLGLNLGSNYAAPEYAEGLAQGFIELEQHEGPYLIHCIEGKDRTGFVCMLLEALAGASYEEILYDYMATYENYYGITRESHPEQYYAVADLMLRDMLCYIADLESDADLTRVDYYEPARAYLRKGGMTDEQIDALVAILIDGEAQELREAA